MATSIDPIDYISPLGRFADAGQLMQSMQLGDAQIASEKAQGQAYQAQAAAQAAKAQRQGLYQQAVTQVLLNPTDKEGYRRLLVQFPEFGEQIKAAHDSLDLDQQRTNLSQATDVAALALGGNFKLAADSLRRRVDADRAAGHVDPQDEQILAELESGDPTRQKAVTGLLAAHVAAIGGVDHFSGIMDSLGKGKQGFKLSQGEKQFDSDGNVIAEVAPKQDFLVIPEGGTAIPTNAVGGGFNQPGGGGQASSGGASGRTQYGWTPRARNGGDNPDAAVDGKLTGMAQFLGRDIDAPITDLSPLQIAKALTLSEGGKGSLADRNNNPGNLTDGKGGYRKFPTKEAGLAAAAAQVARNLKRGQTTIRTMVEGLPVGGKVAAASPGPTTGPNGVIYGQPKPKPVRMTPAEVAAENLDPNIVYYRGVDGIPQPVGGQTKPDTGPLKPVPVASAKQILENRSTLREIDRAIALVKARPNSIGFGTGALGDWFTQRNDPDGTPTRAAVGKIGGKVIHDVSGAAVTLAEAPRFQPYVPTITDTADTALKKLMQMRTLAAADTEDLESAWGPDNGYKGVKLASDGAGGPTRVRSVQEYNKLAPGTHYIDPKGVARIKK